MAGNQKQTPKQPEPTSWPPGPLEGYIDQINQTTKTIVDILVSNLSA